MVEGEAVIDNVVRPHAESVVHQGSHTVIPSKVQGQELSGPLQWQEEAPQSHAGHVHPRALAPYLLCTTMAALGSPVVPDV